MSRDASLLQFAPSENERRARRRAIAERIPRVPDFARISELYPAHLARAELKVVQWAWSKGGGSVARSLIPAFDERHGDAPEPVEFLTRPPKRLIDQTVYGFSRDGKVVIERQHAYGALSAEQFVTYGDSEVEAVHYGHWLVGDPTARNFMVVAEWTWRLSYEHGRPVRCDESARHDGGRMTEHYEYDQNGRLTSVTGNRQTPGLTDHWSLAVHTAPDGQILELVDAEGTRIYPG